MRLWKIRTLTHYWWEYKAVILKKFNKLPDDLAILLLGIDPPKKLRTGVQTKLCTQIFIAALFTTTKRCKQPKCPLIKERNKKIWSIQMMEYYSTIKKNEEPGTDGSHL
jgi:hypothetical protein